MIFCRLLEGGCCCFKETCVSFSLYFIFCIFSTSYKERRELLLINVLARHVHIVTTETQQLSIRIASSSHASQAYTTGRYKRTQHHPSINQSHHLLKPPKPRLHTHNLHTSNKPSTPLSLQNLTDPKKSKSRPPKPPETPKTHPSQSRSTPRVKNSWQKHSRSNSPVSLTVARRPL